MWPQLYLWLYCCIDSSHTKNALSLNFCNSKTICQNKKLHTNNCCYIVWQKILSPKQNKKYLTKMSWQKIEFTFIYLFPCICRYVYVLFYNNILLLVSAKANYYSLTRYSWTDPPSTCNHTKPYYNSHRVRVLNQYTPKQQGSHR